MWSIDPAQVLVIFDDLVGPKQGRKLPFERQFSNLDRQPGWRRKVDYLLYPRAFVDDLILHLAGRGKMDTGTLQVSRHEQKIETLEIGCRHLPEAQTEGPLV